MSVLVRFDQTRQSPIMTRAARKTFPVARSVLALCLAVVVLGGIGLALRGLAASEPAKQGVFALRATSVFDQKDEAFLRGQWVRCQDQPFPEVRAYPPFASKAPIYGSVRFGPSPDEVNSGVLFYFALDESDGTGKGYDRLFFDHNRDLDLRNDPVARRQAHPPSRATAGTHLAGIKEQVIFDFIKVHQGTEAAGTAPVEIMPRLILAGQDAKVYKHMTFVRTEVFEGDIQVAGERLKARLGNDFAITLGFDSPLTALVLSPKRTPDKRAFDWWGADRLMAVQKIHGRFFTFAATPAGDQLTVRPYEGDLGTFAIGPGKRAVTQLSVSGSFQAPNRTVPVGGDIEVGRPNPVPKCQVPVGNYLPEILDIGFGRLEIEVSQNYHSEGKRQSRVGRPLVYGIAIRKDQPFVLDFSNQPDVMFTSPTNGQRIKLGDTVMVSAVLVDPKLDMMIRRLEDTSRKQTKDADGKPLGYERNLSLDPKVIITRADGRKIAEGVMPFG